MLSLCDSSVNWFSGNMKAFVLVKHFCSIVFEHPIKRFFAVFRGDSFIDNSNTGQKEVFLQNLDISIL